MKEFFGWYFKCQSQRHTVAVIGAVHGKKGEETCSIQLLTDREAHSVGFPFGPQERSREHLQIAGNRMGRDGIYLDINAPGVSASGLLSFEELSPIRYDIMGPFRYVPFLECRHSILSMRHRVNGSLVINGHAYAFCDDLGYWEGDRGRSFPQSYAWAQCLFPGGSLMLSVATVPMAGGCFTGCLALVLLDGREYRLATYFGARVEVLRQGRIVLQQGKKRLEVCLPEQKAEPLQAPVQGEMSRIIHENVSVRAQCRFWLGRQLLLELDGQNTSFEYEYPQ